jgi:predicted dehydrogenase
MGPYYLTALVHLLGPIASVSASAKITFPSRTITSAKKYGTLVPVETPTHIASTYSFHNGVTAQMLMSFDIFGANLPRIEVYGTEGSISVPDPNMFGGEVKVKVGRRDWAAVPHSHGYSDNYRGLGLSDLASALQTRRNHRANAQLAFHILDTMQTTLESAQAQRTLAIASTTDRPLPLPLALPDGLID